MMEIQRSWCGSSALAAAWHMEDAASHVWLALHAMQPKGSDGAGISSADGTRVYTVKKAGMLDEALPSSSLKDLPGTDAIGQIQMKAFNEQSARLQPVIIRNQLGSFSVVYSGMSTNAPSLRASLMEQGLVFQGLSDAEVLAHLIQKADGTITEKLLQAIDALHGSYAFVLMTKNTMYAYRSSDGLQSLWMADCQDGVLFASESAAFVMEPADNLHEITPGALVRLGKGRRDEIVVKKAAEKVCPMEAVYYSRSSSLIDGCSVHRIRQKSGKLLAKGEASQADLVIGVPDTAMSAAAAFARELHLPFEMGLIKNRYIGSTFVHPTKEQREKGMRVRLNACSSVVKGKRVFVVDDSIQKGMTARRLCQLLKEAGAKEVHLRICSARITDSCYFGKEYIDQKNLCAAHYSDEELCELFKADSIRFPREEDLASLFETETCMACFGKKTETDLEDFA